MADGDPTISVDPIIPQTGDQTPTPSADSPPPAPKPSDQPDMGQLTVDAYTRAMQHQEDVERRVAPLYDQLEKSLSQPIPPAPQLERAPAPPTQQQLSQQLNKGVFSYLAVGLPLAIILGSKGRGASWAAMGAFGQGLKALRQGNQEQASESFKTWQESAAQVKADNAEKMNQYKEVLENRKLNLDQQMQLIGVIAEHYGDGKLNQFSMLKDISAIQKNLADKDIAQRKFNDEHDALSIEQLKKMGESAEAQAYRGHMISEANIDPYASADNYMKAQKMEPFDKWAVDYKKKTQKETATGTHDTMYQQWQDYIGEAFREKTGHTPQNDTEWNQAMKITPYTEWVKELRKPGGTDPKTGKPYGFEGPAKGTSPEDYQKSLDSLKDLFKPKVQTEGLFESGGGGENP